MRQEGSGGRYPSSAVICCLSGTCATQPWETTSGTGSTGHIGSAESESGSQE